MSATVPLVATKLHIPPAVSTLAPRPRLLDKLNEGLRLGRRMTLVSAPPGYGKTTLLSYWAHHCQPAVAWLSLDEEDSDPARFLAYFVAALRQIGAVAGDTALAGAASLQPFSARAVLPALIEEIEAAGRTFALVLDDYHLIQATPVHDALTYLLDHQPPKMHLVIATRADPPLPLARLRARGQLAELRQSDLRFTPEETTDFLNQVMGLGLEAGDVNLLASRTEGWIAGLQLAATSIQARGDAHRFIQDFGGSNRYILDYLVEEVLQRQPPDVQAFLLQTSLLHRLTGPLCDAVVGGQAPGPWSQGMLEMLERANLFIVPLDDERKWYRYHRLFADLLQKRLGESRPELVPILHRRASAWHEENGLMAEAIDHALAAKDFERAAQLIERIAESTLMRSESATLLRWLNALPEAQVRARPSLCVSHAWVLLLGGSPLEAVEARLIPVEGDRAPLVLPLRAIVAYYRGDIAAALELSRRALERLPESEVFLRGLATLSLAMVYHTSGDVAASRQALHEAALAGHQAGNAMIAVTAACYRAGLCRREGSLRQARSLYQQALDLATDSSGDRLPIASEALMGLGEIAREWNELDAATRYVSEGVELARGWAEAGALEGYLTLARIRQAQGDWGGVREALQRMRRLATEFKASEAGERMVDMAEAWMQIVQCDPSLRSGQAPSLRSGQAPSLRSGQAPSLRSAEAPSAGSGQALDGPRRWAERYGLIGNVDPLALEKEGDVTLRRLRKYEYPVVARLWMAEGHPAQAMALLESALPIAEKMNRVGLVIGYQVLIALAAQALSQNGKAMQSLERALALAEPEGFVRIFVDEGKPMARLLYEAASHRIRPEYAGRLLAAFPGDRGWVTGDGRGGPGTPAPSPITHHPSPTVEPLSERELEVLRLVALGLSNEEIAQRLVVSLPTIKFHTSNIYGKLAVKNRTEAVARARGLGLLPLA